MRIALWGAAAQAATEREWHETQHLTPRPDGSVEITMELNNLVDVTNKILYWGGDAGALQPPALRTRVRDAAKAAWARYSA